MEIGSFIELDIREGAEYYPDIQHTARLNSGRAGIYHALRILDCNTISIPYYLCPTVKKFLDQHNVEVHEYFITEEFTPVLDPPEEDHVVLIVNYFGILSQERLKKISMPYSKVVIDNCPAFYTKPFDPYMHVYSARKFFGTPDGCYVLGKDAHTLMDEYPEDRSSDTAGFLLKRIEYGSETVYPERMINEKRIDEADVHKMSRLTQTLLKGIDYRSIGVKRRSNFLYAHELHETYNLLDPLQYMDDESVPIVYPLVIEDDSLVGRLQRERIYSGRWWNHVLERVPADSYEAFLSRFMIPLPIDQRYGMQEILHCSNVIREFL